jgi:oligopeptide/dipeptide ABC transporter ATP-binding protein
MKKTVAPKRRKPVIDVKNLKVNFHTYRGEVKALNGVDLKLYEGEVLGVVGESGCGKSVTALTILGLLPENGYVLEGQALFRGQDLLKKSAEERRILRSSELATIFQDPMTYLNPVLKIETQLKEVFMLNKNFLRSVAFLQNTQGKEITFLETLSLEKKPIIGSREIKATRADIKGAAKKLAIDLLRLIKMPDPERVLREYPFELSGGMRQRAMIAMALARRPSVLIADEITTAVDVTIQAQILRLLEELRDKINAAVMLITHDLSVAAEVADRIAVMYGGSVVEVAATREIFKNPLHPYTLMLMRAIPNVKKPVKRLEFIPGTVPDMVDPPSGCRFHPRCPSKKAICTKDTPQLREVSSGHEVACF